MKHLRTAGIEPIVLSGVTGEPDPVLHHRQILPWGPAGLRFDLRHLVARRFGRGAVYRALTLLFSMPLVPLIALEWMLTGLRNHWSWAIPATLHSAWICRRQRIELVYSTGGSYSAHLAGYWLKRWFGCRWIAEIHDPMLVPGLPVTTRNQRFQAWLEGRICAKADLAWWFTDGALAAARSRHPSLGEHGIVVLPGAEPPVTRSEYVRGEVLRLGHFGSLSSTRSLAPLLQGLASVLVRRPDLRERIRLEVYGSALDPESARLRKSLGLEAVVVCHGRLERDPATGQSGRERVVERMQKLDVLVLAHGALQDCSEYIPSKLYEYFWARRPILAVTHQNAQLDQLVAAHGGWTASTIDTNSIVQALETAVQRWEDNTLAEVAVAPIGVRDAVHAILQTLDRLPPR
jgi:glycosyltransferase involved in cell wall biosynthesis